MKQIFQTMLVVALLACSCAHHPHKRVAAELLDEKVLVDRVKLALQKEGAGNFQNVRVDVSNGTVTLRGTVRDAQTQIRVGEIAKKVEQVKAVDNQLKIDSEPR